MPFQSKSQQRFMFAKHPEMAKEWADKTPDISALPEHAKKMADGGFSGLMDNVKSGKNDAAAADAIDPVVSPSTDTIKGNQPEPTKMAEGGTSSNDNTSGFPDEPGLKDATTSDFLLPYLLGASPMGSDMAEGAGAKLADEAGAIFPQKAPLMEDAVEGATTNDVVAPNKVEVYVKGIQKGAPGGAGDVKIYGVKGDPAQLKQMFGDEAPGSVPEHILQQKGLLPAPSAPVMQPSPTRYCDGGPAGMSDGGYPHVTFLENESPAKAAKDVHLNVAKGGIIQGGDDSKRDKEPAKPKNVEMSHENKLNSIYKAMGIKKYADGGEVGDVDASQLPGGTPTPNSSDPGFWDKIKAALGAVGTATGNALPTMPSVAQGAADVASAPGIAPAVNAAIGTNLQDPNPPMPAPSAVPPMTPPAAMPTPPPVMPARPMAVPSAPPPSGMPNLGTIFNQDASGLTKGFNPEDRQALVDQLKAKQHSAINVLGEALAGIGDAISARGGHEQHSLDNIFAMQKQQRDEALNNFDQARQDRMQKLQLQTQMGNNALNQAAAADAYGVDNHLNSMVGAPTGTMKKDLPTYFSMMSAQIAAKEKDEDLYMKAASQAANDVDNSVKNSTALGFKPTTDQLQSRGQQLTQRYIAQAKGLYHSATNPTTGHQVESYDGGQTWADAGAK